MKKNFAAILFSTLCAFVSVSASAADFVWGVPSGSCVSTDPAIQPPFEMTIYSSMISPSTSAMIATVAGDYRNLYQVSLTFDQQALRAEYMTPAVSGGNQSKLVIDFSNWTGVWSDADGKNPIQLLCKELPLVLPTP